MMNHDDGRSNALCRIRLDRLAQLTRLLALFLTLLPFAACSTTPEGFEDPDSPGAGMVRLGDQLRARGDSAGAAEFYNRAIQRDPKSAAAHRGMGAVLEQAGHNAEAVDEYQAAVRLRPEDLESQRNLGRVLLALDRHAEAREAYVAALAIDSRDTKAMNGLGVALNKLGDYQGAQKQFEEALKQDPENLATTNNLAYAYILDGRYSEAIQLLEPHVKAPGSSPALRQNLVMAYALNGLDLDAERVAKIDLPPQRVKETLAHYKRQRAELAVSTTPYAELGAYPTEAMAEAHIASLGRHLDEAGVDLKPVIAPQVTTSGGTPRFTVRMLGCSRPEDVDVFCGQLAKHGIPCNVRGK